MKNKLVILVIMFFSLFLITGCNKEEAEEKKVETSSRELTENEKKDMLNVVDKLKYMDYYNKDIIPRDLTNQEALRISYEILALEEKVMPGKLKFSDLEKTAMNYLGFILEPENLVCDTHYNIQDKAGADILIYNIETGVYSYNSKHLGHGAGGLRTEVYNNYVEGYEKDGVYTIVVNKIFSDIKGDINEDESNYYATYKDSSNYENKLFTAGMVDNKKFSEYKDDLVKYTYKFILKDNNYVLSSYKIG